MTPGFAFTNSGVDRSLPKTACFTASLRVTTAARSSVARRPGFALSTYDEYVAPRASAPTRAGCRSTSSCAIMPPMEIPKTPARSTPAASQHRLGVVGQSSIMNERRRLADSRCRSCRR